MSDNPLSDLFAKLSEASEPDETLTLRPTSGATITVADLRRAVAKAEALGVADSALVRAGLSTEGMWDFSAQGALLTRLYLPLGE